MVNDVTRAFPCGAIGAWAWISLLELSNDARITLDPIVVIPNNAFGICRECNKTYGK